MQWPSVHSPRNLLTSDHGRGPNGGDATGHRGPTGRRNDTGDIRDSIRKKVRSHTQWGSIRTGTPAGSNNNDAPGDQREYQTKPAPARMLQEAPGPLTVQNISDNALS